MAEKPNIKAAPEALTPITTSWVIEWLDAQRAPLPEYPPLVRAYFNHDPMKKWVGEERG